MEEINCNLPNDTFDTEEWKRIEDNCKKYHHLDNNDDLQKLITEDEQTLVKYGITFQQLDDLFTKIKYHFNHASNIILTDEQV